MSDSILKKEFRRSDVERARNLIKGNFSESTRSQIGYRAAADTTIHKEGDVWTDASGKEWTIEDGLKVAKTKLGKARKLHNIPLLCPKCGKPLNTRLDKKMYPIHGFCFDCLVKFEDDLKRAGLYQEYENNMMKQNIRSFVDTLKDRINSMRNDSKTSVIAEDGTVESWGTTNSLLVDGLEQWATLLSEYLN